MQTFLPYPSFSMSAKCLDNRRLGKQRVETLQILNTLCGNSEGWKNHPAVKMWKNYEVALLYYGISMCDEWVRKGFNDTCKQKMIKIALDNKNFFSKGINVPPWFGSKEFHASHRSNLLRKNPEHYLKFNWTEPNNLPYVWS